MVDNTMTISQYHNTIPFYKGNFQYLENSLDNLQKLNEVYDEYYYDYSEDKFDEINERIEGEPKKDFSGKIGKRDHYNCNNTITLF